MDVQNGLISAVAPAAPATAAPTPPPAAAPAPAVRSAPRPTEFANPNHVPASAPAPKFEEPVTVGDPGDEQPEPPVEEVKTDVATSEMKPVDPMQQAAAHELYRAARSLGMSPAEITAFQTPQQLQAAVAAASRIARAAQPQMRPQAQQTPPEAPVEDEFPEAYLKEQGVDDKVISAMKRGFEAEARAKALEATITEKFARLEAVEQARQREAYFQTLDHSFASLGDDFKPVFGDGSGQQMAPNSPELMRRNAVIQIAVQQQQQYQAAGYAPPPFPELLAQAASAMFGVQQQTAQQKTATAERLRAQNGQFLPRPTSREVPTPKGDAAALQTLRQRMNGNGVIYDDADAEIESTLLK